MPALVVAALQLLGAAQSTADPEMAAEQLMSAVANLWSSEDITATVTSSDTSLLGAGESVNSGTVDLPPLVWTGSDPGPESLVDCSGCSISATRSLEYQFTVGMSGALEDLSLIVHTDGNVTFTFEAQFPELNSTSALVAPQTEHLITMVEDTTTVDVGGVQLDLDLTTDISSVFIGISVDDEPDPINGQISLALSARSGITYSPVTGILPFADESSVYIGEALSVEEGNNELQTSAGFAAHVAIHVVQDLQVGGLAAVTSTLQPAMQVFSAPGSTVLAGDEFFFDQAYLCLFDGDCPNDEVCISTGECFSYQRGSLYCTSPFVDCTGGDPGCLDSDDCGGQSCNAENCRIFHTHGDNLEKYNAQCCGAESEDDLAFTCEFETVRHVILSQDLPISDINDDNEDRGPLLVAIANIEGIVCGMGDPTHCVRIDEISAAPGGYAAGFVATATVARNCGIMELYVMSIYGCFDECDGIGNLPGIFHATSLGRRLSSDEEELRIAAIEKRRQLQTPLDPIASSCPESNVVNYAINVAVAGEVVHDSSGQSVSAQAPEVRSHVEPVDRGCVALELANSDDVDILTMPVVVQHGSTWAGEVRYIGTDTDARNGNSVCADTYGFAAGFLAGRDFGSLSMQVVNTTDMMSRLPTFHTQLLFDWGSMPTVGDSDSSSAFGCTVDTTADIQLDLRVKSSWVTETTPNTANRRECWTASGAAMTPPELRFSGSLSQLRGNVLNLTDADQCWLAGLTTIGNTPLSQGLCGCDMGYWRPECEVEEEDGGVCIPCQILPEHHYYSSDGGAFWNGCVFAPCVDDCGVGRYRTGCGGTSPGHCRNCTTSLSETFGGFTSSGGFTDDCDVDLVVIPDESDAEDNGTWNAAEISAITIGILVVVALVVLTIMIVLKKRRDRLNDVHKAMQLTSHSQLKASTTVAEDEGYSSFGGDIIID